MEALLEQRAGVALSGVSRVLGCRAVLDGLELEVPLHSRLGIVGRSGSGKSTLLSLVAGLDKVEPIPTTGYEFLGCSDPENGLEGRSSLGPSI